jgi:predicted DCC family thiol-disulfide oxidoreductase YuxK
LRVFRHLSGGWKILGGLRVIPRPLRDWFYDIISRNRYAWFGKRNECMMFSTGFKDRFIEGSEENFDRSP